MVRLEKKPITSKLDVEAENFLWEDEFHSEWYKRQENGGGVSSYFWGDANDVAGFLDK